MRPGPADVRLSIVSAADLGPQPPGPSTRETVVAWLSALVLPIGVAAAFIPLRAHVAATDVALLLTVVILVAAILGGRVVGAVAAFDAAFAFDLFFTRPYYSSASTAPRRSRPRCSC